MRSLILPLLVLAPLAAADTFTVDAVHSGALFKVLHLDSAWTYGRFTEMSGTVVPGQSVNVTIPLKSLNTDNAKRDEHLRGPDFFSAKQFPEMTFASTAWTQVDDKTATVAGTLTIKGVAKPVTLTVTKVGENPKTAFGDHRIGFETSFTIKRTDFGVAAMTDKIGDEVHLTIGVEGIKAK
jgi:polyisoprenoid-binding protein YceI